MTSGGAGEIRRFDLSGIRVELSGELSLLEPRLTDLFGAFVAAPVADAALRCRVRFDPVGRFDGPFDPKSMRAGFERGGAVFEMGTGRAEVGPGGEASLSIGPVDEGRRFYTALNLVVACLAWIAPRHGALVIHAAACVLDGRAFLLVGAEGAGKSTFARCAREGGAEILSDDLVVVRLARDGAEVLRSPVRAEGAAGPGRFPLAAVLFSEHAPTPSLATLPALLAHAKIAANLPFVQESFAVDPLPLEVAAALLRRVPSRILRFAPDPGFLPLLRAFPAVP